MDMNMTFYWAENVALLFDSWKTNPFISMAIILLFSWLFGVVFDYVTNFLIRFKILDPQLLSKLANGGKLSKFVGAVLFLVSSVVAFMIGFAFGYFVYKS